MTDTPDRAGEPQTLADLPIQPTGSGVKDLEMAYEQMRLSAPDHGGADGEVAAGSPVPTENTEEAADSAAHPS